MKAIGITAAGGPEVLQIVDVEEPSRQPDQHQIRVHAAAINPTDTVLRTSGGRGRMTTPPPWVAGMDIAGVIETAADGSGLSVVGTRVMAMTLPTGSQTGAQAEYAVVSQASVVEIPDDMSYLEACTIPMNALTAHLALSAVGLTAGETLAVTGGAGHLATYVIAWAVDRRLRVIADAGESDRDAVAAVGAQVVDRGPGLAARIRSMAPNGVDGLIDTAVLGPEILSAVCDAGRLVSPRAWKADSERGITIQQIAVGTYLNENPAPLREVRQAVDRGILRPRVAGVFTPAQAANAYRRFEMGGTRGRLVFDLNPDDPTTWAP